MSEPTLPGHQAIAQTETGLIEAASSGNLAAVNAAIKAGADLEARGKMAKRPCSPRPTPIASMLHAL